MDLHWWKSRWRTRGEYAWTARRLLTRYGCGLAVPLLFVAAILVGLFWVLGGASRSGARAVRVDEIAARIIATVETGNPAQPTALEDFVAAGVLTAEDVTFLAKEEVIFYPFRRISPDTAIVFRRVDGGVERVHRKNGSEDYYTRAVSPDGRYEVVVGPPAPGRHPGTGLAGGPLRSVTLRALPAGGGPARLVTTFLVPDFAQAHWSSDGRHVAIEARPAAEGRGADLETFVLAVSPTGARRLDLPPSIRPQALLPPADRAARLQAASVRVLAWRDARLVVRSEGHGWIGPPGEATSRYVTVRCRIALEVGGGGIRELERRC